MKFVCEQCQKDMPHFKAYLDHYKKHHPGMLKRYEIHHPKDRVRLLGYAPSSDILIQAQGWNKEDCINIKEIE